MGMLRADRMRVLREVARQGSFSAAADALHLTQPAVSRHVAKLERETGMRLVDRLPGRLRLTDAGRALVEHAETVMAALSAAERSLDALRGAQAGSLRIASFPSAAATLVAGALRAFHREHPDVEVGFVDAQSDEALAVVRAGEADVALAFACWRSSAIVSRPRCPRPTRSRRASACTCTSCATRAGSSAPPPR